MLPSQQIGRPKPIGSPLEAGLRSSWCPRFKLVSSLGVCQVAQHGPSLREPDTSDLGTSVTHRVRDAHFQHSRLRGSSRVCHLQRWGGGPHGALSSSCGLKGRPSSRSAQFQVRAQHVERTTLAGRANNQHPVTNTPCALPIQCQSQQIGRTKPSDPPLEVGLRCSWCPSFAL